VIRGVAVGLVLLRHGWPTLFSGAGVVGVTMFFALSGYLITGIIQREVEREGSLSFARFYRNRALRLLPALALLLLVFTVVELTTDRLGDRDRVVVSLLVAACYLADVPGLDVSAGLSHLWTLAVEEQFYLVWPTVLILALRRRRVGTLLAVGAGLAVALSLASAALLHPAGRAYTLPTSWASALLIGAAARLYQGRLTALVRSPAAQLAAIGLLAICCLAPEAKDRAATYVVGGPLIAISTAVLILRGRTVDRLPAGLEPLRRLGLVSYGVYLWNYLVVNWLHPVDPAGLSGPQAVLSVVLTILLALASWGLVESRALRLKERWDAGRSGPADRRPDRAR
jgi:peptidoglycan/LPS O-acetylase OafA/YrhL